MVYLLAFALSGRGLFGAIFHRALPCAMGFLPRWGGLVLPVRFPPQLSASDNDSLATQPPGGRLPTLRYQHISHPIGTRASLAPTTFGVSVNRHVLRHISSGASLRR
ncbi:MAG: hypothetical protein LBQ66_06115 [Planctomycetaceae bacterium]|nr:hypothetical protein [Planctomycetaceae bacterium]